MLRRESINTEILIKPSTALISVSDKTGITDFGKALAETGVEILSTGGTAQALSGAGIKVKSVSDHTGFPEMMDGRVKTLHPKIHGGILGRKDVDLKEMQRNGIQPINLIAVNLYPFERVSSDPKASFETVVDNIDIGGPAMIRAAAKNFAWTCVIVDSSDYEMVIEEIQSLGGTRLETRRRLATKAFARTAYYDSVIAGYMRERDENSPDYPATLSLPFRKIMNMRYGENPHQSAAFYVAGSGTKGWFENATIHQGKPLSFNNVADADAAYCCIEDFDEPACVIIKHATPCGVACAKDITAAYELAYRTDPTSAFGGIIAVNRTLDASTVTQILNNQFVEVILAPGVDKEALNLLSHKQNIRLLEHPPQNPQSATGEVFKTACEGVLFQDSDSSILAYDEPKVMSARAPNEREMRDLLFAWRVAKHVKSNAIVYAKDLATVGIGAGQMSRVDSAQIASLKSASAGLAVAGAVMASDAFFPFRDSIDTAAGAGISAVIQPGGSMRDDEVIAAADEYDLAMVFTGMRHFRH